MTKPVTNTTKSGQLVPPILQLRTGYKCLGTAVSGLGGDRPLAYGVVFLRLGSGLGCFSPAIDNYID
jgi:hypothetical protein